MFDISFSYDVLMTFLITLYEIVRFILELGFRRYFGSFLDRLLELLEIKRSSKYQQKSMRKLALEKIGSEEGRARTNIPGG